MGEVSAVLEGTFKDYVPYENYTEFKGRNR